MQTIKRTLLALALAISCFSVRDYLDIPQVVRLPALTITAHAGPYNRQVSVTGGSAQQLSAVLTTAGYTGVFSLQELTIVNPAGAANDLYFGQSDVDASNGVKLSPGDSYTMRATSQTDQIEATRIYLFTASTQNAAVALRSK